ncbi:MAG: hypothetical protein LBQ52_00695 [Helicobacteraceae bacterium]|jgi:hypothetical protein|nr:hypothetical protein [Helicobacteraceae bacterium]
MVVTRFTALLALLLVLFQPPQTFAGNRVELPFDENSFGYLYQGDDEISLSIFPIPNDYYYGLFSLHDVKLHLAYMPKGLPSIMANIKLVGEIQSNPNSKLKIYNTPTAAGDLSIYNIIGFDLLLTDETMCSEFKARSANNDENQVGLFNKFSSADHPDGALFGLWKNYYHNGEDCKYYVLREEFVLDYNSTANSDYCLPVSIKNKIANTGFIYPKNPIANAKKASIGTKRAKPANRKRQEYIFLTASHTR